MAWKLIDKGIIHMNIINISKVLLISMCILATQAHSLGYVSRACSNGGAIEAFTMSWTSNQWMITRAYLPKIDPCYAWFQMGEVGFASNPRRLEFHLALCSWHSPMDAC